MIEVLFVLIIASLATSVLGVFLVLKNQAMTTDAISHTIPVSYTHLTLPTILLV